MIFFVVVLCYFCLFYSFRSLTYENMSFSKMKKSQQTGRRHLPCSKERLNNALERSECANFFFFLSFFNQRLLCVFQPQRKTVKSQAIVAQQTTNFQINFSRPELLSAETQSHFNDP